MNLMSNVNRPTRTKWRLLEEFMYLHTIIKKKVFYTDDTYKIVADLKINVNTRYSKYFDQSPKQRHLNEIVISLRCIYGSCYNT